MTTVESLAALRERQNSMLPHMLSLCETAHPYYSKLFSQLGVTAADFNSVEDLERLPT